MSVVPLSRAGLWLLAGPQRTCTEAWETNRVAKGAEPRALLVLHHTASSSTLNESTDFCYLSKHILKRNGHYFYCGCLVRKDIRVRQAGGRCLSDSLWSQLLHSPLLLVPQFDVNPEAAKKCIQCCGIIMKAVFILQIPQRAPRTPRGLWSRL